MKISFNLDRKLILLVMIVSVIALSIIGYFSFNYSDEILKQKVGDQLIGESAIRGETLRLIFESRMDQNDILANDPMINTLILKMNSVPTKDLQQFKDRKSTRLNSSHVRTSRMPSSA